jgi:acyl carrier protein
MAASAYDEILSYLTGTFEVPAASITPEARLMEDLNLDSIDAVDMMVKLQESTGQKVSPEQFEGVKTVKDLVALVEKLKSGK